MRVVELQPLERAWTQDGDPPHHSDANGLAEYINSGTNIKLQYLNELLVSPKNSARTRAADPASRAPLSLAQVAKRPGGAGPRATHVRSLGSFEQNSESD